jgi:hypothetical protein
MLVRQLLQDCQQGSSHGATQYKQDSIRGIARMAALRQKNTSGLKVFADVFSGSGENVVDGEIIDGSPISILSGVVDAIQSMRGAYAGSYAVYFADIVTGRATDMLLSVITRWAASCGYPFTHTGNTGILQVYKYDGGEGRVDIYLSESPASDSMAIIGNGLLSRRIERVTVFIDPNGPKHAPWRETMAIWRHFSSRSTIIIHIASTTLKRIAGARRAGCNMPDGIPDHVAEMIHWFKGAGGWIREPINADQWTIAMLAKYPPTHDWQKGGFHAIDSDEGQALIKRLSTTKKEKTCK